MAGVYTVTQINTYIKNMFAKDFALNNISIEGEVSNCKYHTRGHIYFTLKDEGATISCVMFGSKAELLEFRLKDGQKIEARGQIMVYEKNGTYQLYVTSIKKSGQGVLYEKFLKLKTELLDMGMFDASYKKEIPRYAKRIGIVTAPTGAAIRDICQISLRRNPYVELVLYPALVQGENAKYSIVKGIETLDEMNLDVIIVGRGGGSIEDLWAFNEEIVARAVFDANTPIISAVGHETDVTICDYVADLRAPTPSAAAELANFEYEAFIEELALINTSLLSAVKNKLNRLDKELIDKKLRLKAHDPKLELQRKYQKLDFYLNSYEYSLKNKLKDTKARLDSDSKNIEVGINVKLKELKHRLMILAGRQEALSPLKKISGGYGYIMDDEGKTIYSVKDIKQGDEIVTVIRDGKIRSVVKDIEQ
ncbi:MAG: exodeoxyribonuclease VII large subunit [Eubacteriales bacterium]|nr:exodeoxyribonuclease VII large subunit [Eubacteriales bacterium]